MESVINVCLERSKVERKRVVQEARHGGNDNRLWQTVTSKWAAINLQLQRGVPASQLELGLCDLWFMYFESSKHIQFHHPALYRLVFQALQAKAQFTLSIHTVSKPRVQPQPGLETSEDRVGTGLPFFTHYMTKFWIASYPTISLPERFGLSSFLSRLANVGVDDQLCGITLSIFRDALETPRPLGDLRLKENSHSRVERTMRDLSVSELLVAANCWVFEAGRRIIQLSYEGHNNFPRDVGYTGPLYKQGMGNGTIMPSGFSVGRWLFWLRRLQAISNQAATECRTDLAMLSARVMDGMIIALEQMNPFIQDRFNLSTVKPGYKVHVYEAGEALRVAWPVNDGETT